MLLNLIWRRSCLEDRSHRIQLFLARGEGEIEVFPFAASGGSLQKLQVEFHVCMVCFELCRQVIPIARSWTTVSTFLASEYCLFGHGNFLDHPGSGPPGEPFNPGVCQVQSVKFRITSFSQRQEAFLYRKAVEIYFAFRTIRLYLNLNTREEIMDLVH